MNLRDYRQIAVVAASAFVLSLAPAAWPQTMAEMGTAMSMQDTLSGASTGPNVSGGFNPIQRAQDAAAMSGAQPMPGFPGAVGGVPGAPGAFGVPGVPGQNITGITLNRGPMITVVTGTRVFDAISGQLLDDAQEKQVSEADKANYFDDGTHGDLSAADGKFTRVDQRSDVIGQSHQRIKERLVNALIIAEGLDPLQFYGFTLMSTDRSEPVPRNVAWKMIPDPKGGPGRVLAEVGPTTESIVVPKYRTWEQKKDVEVIRGDWVKNFLVEYRKTKDSLSSEFYPLYVPVPPPVPHAVPPPTWKPFSDPSALAKAEAAAMQQARSTVGYGRTGRGGRGQLNQGLGANRPPSARGSTPGMGRSTRY